MTRGARKTRDDIKTRLRARRRAADAPEGFLSRAALLERVGITEGQLRAILAHKMVSADGHNADGYAMYSEKIVQKLLTKKADGSLFRFMTRSGAPTPVEQAQLGPSVYTPEQGVRVFEMLSQGKSLEAIILELGRDPKLRVHPTVAKRIQSDYIDISGSILLPRIVVEQLNQLGGLPGSFPLTEAQSVVDVFEECAAARRCTECNERVAASWCITCLNADVRAHRRARVDAPEQQNGYPPIHSMQPLQPVLQSERHQHAATAPRRAAPAPAVSPPVGVVDDSELPPIDGVLDAPLAAPRKLPDAAPPAPLPAGLFPPSEE